MIAISRRARFAPRQKCAPPPPKATWLFGVRAMSKRNGSSNAVLVAVRRRVPQRDAVAFGDRDAADLGRAGCPAREVGDGRRPTEDLLDRRSHRVGVAAQAARAGRDGRGARSARRRSRCGSSRCPRSSARRRTCRARSRRARCVRRRRSRSRRWKGSSTRRPAGSARLRRPSSCAYSNICTWIDEELVRRRDVAARRRLAAVRSSGRRAIRDPRAGCRRCRRSCASAAGTRRLGRSRTCRVRSACSTIATAHSRACASSRPTMRGVKPALIRRR